MLHPFGSGVRGQSAACREYALIARGEFLLSQTAPWFLGELQVHMKSLCCQSKGKVPYWESGKLGWDVKRSRCCVQCDHQPYSCSRVMLRFCFLSTSCCMMSLDWLLLSLYFYLGVFAHVVCLQRVFLLLLIWLIISLFQFVLKCHSLKGTFLNHLAKVIFAGAFLVSLVTFTVGSHLMHFFVFVCFFHYSVNL